MAAPLRDISRRGELFPNPLSDLLNEAGQMLDTASNSVKLFLRSHQVMVKGPAPTRL